MTPARSGTPRGLVPVAALAAAALYLAPLSGAVALSDFGAAHAESHAEGGAHGGSGKEGESHGGGHDEGGHDEGEEGGGHTGGAGGSGGRSGGRGGHGGSGADAGGSNGAGAGGNGQAQGGGAGGRPVWAQEGLPEVELGRLNVVRSPDRVLDRAHAEALATFTPEMAAFYSLPLDQMVLRLSTDFGEIAMLDSPLQNLALYKDALDGTSALAQAGVRNSTGTLLAAFLGTASDKSLPISAETVQAVSLILGYRVDAGTAATLAQEAEAIRIAILAGHG